MALSPFEFRVMKNTRHCMAHAARRYRRRPLSLGQYTHAWRTKGAGHANPHKHGDTRIKLQLICARIQVLRRSSRQATVVCPAGHIRRRQRRTCRRGAQSSFTPLRIRAGGRHPEGRRPPVVYRPGGGRLRAAHACLPAPAPLPAPFTCSHASSAARRRRRGPHPGRPGPGPPRRQGSCRRRRSWEPRARRAWASRAPCRSS